MGGQNVLVIIGAGGMGVACLRRLGNGRIIILADKSNEALDRVIPELEFEGYRIERHVVDIFNASSVKDLVSKAASLGRVETVIAAAGIWPLKGQPAFLVYGVDLLGTSSVIDEFLEVATPGMSLVAISSIQGHQMVSQELDNHLIYAPTSKLLSHPAINIERDDPEYAHRVSKRGVQLRVKAASKAYVDKGARINSISPGMILTPSSRLFLADGDVQQLSKKLEAKRFGTPAELAAAAAFLAGPEASFICGTDLVVDGGQSALGDSCRIEHLGGPHPRC